MVDLSLVIPVYNERDSIESTLKEIHTAFAEDGRNRDGKLIDYEVIVVNDGSTDGSGEILANCTDIRLIDLPRNRGYGAALKTGIRAARSDRIAITDADGTYPNRRIPELYRTLTAGDLDMIVASRTGENVHIPLIRRPPKWALNRLANYLTNTRIPDLNSGLRLFSRDLALHHFPLISDGFSFTTTITLALLVNACRVEYVPIEYSHRTGSSKIRPIKDTLNFLVLIVRTIAYFNPLKIFIPVSLVLFLFALMGLAYQLYTGNIGDTSVILFLSSLQIFLIGLLADMISRKG